jgi:hypothetical protein
MTTKQGKPAKSSSSKEKNRQLMPQCAAWVDDIRNHFGEVTVTYAKENGIEKGKKDQEGFPSYR